MQSAKPQPPSVVKRTHIEKTSRGIRFTVHDIEEAIVPLPTEPAREALSKLLESPLEATCFDSESGGPLAVTKFVAVDRESKQPLIMSAYRAYASHRPLVISPDVVWLTIAQGFGHHINLNPEKYRELLVNHKHDKETLTVAVNTNEPSAQDWPAILEAFCQQISNANTEKGKRMVEWGVPTFSTTGPIEKAAFQVATMDIYKAFHNYEMVCICGIPSIELTGTPQDWRMIESRLDALDEYGLDWWTKALKPICHQFVEASEGRIDLGHWDKIIKKSATYGTELLDGWLVKLVPYLVDFVTGQAESPNSLVEEAIEDIKDAPVEYSSFGQGHGVPPGSLPNGISQVPFVQTNVTSGSAMSKEFIAGLAGIQQHDDTGALEAKAGWAIRKREGLSVALDQIGQRKLWEGPAVPLDWSHIGNSMVGESFEILDRGNGARICTKSGAQCGRLFPLKEMSQRKRPHYRYWHVVGQLDGKMVGIEIGRHAAEGNKIYLFDNDAFEANPAAEFEESKEDLGSLLLEALNRP